MDCLVKRSIYLHTCIKIRKKLPFGKYFTTTENIVQSSFYIRISFKN